MRDTNLLKHGERKSDITGMIGQGMPRSRRQRRSKRGQTLVEYALILAFISVVAISVLLRLGSQVKSVFSTITSQLAQAQSSH